MWTNDTLIRAHLWPILKKWNSSEGSEVKDAAAVCVVRLIGECMSCEPVAKTSEFMSPNPDLHCMCTTFPC